MNDESLEHHLRKIPAPELPETWRTEILATALRKARPPQRSSWPPLLLILRNLFARNPITAGVLTTLWMLIFLFKATTPVDPLEKEMIAHYDPNRPVYFVSIHDEILLAELLQNQSDPTPAQRIP